MNYSLSQLLDELPEWSANKIHENLEHVLPILQSSVNEPRGENVTVHSVQLLLKSCLPCLPISSAQTDIFQYALPAAKDAFHLALENIGSQLSNADHMHADTVCDNLSSSLGVCIDLLDSVDEALNYVSTKGKVPIGDLKSIPNSTVSILHDAFLHFKNSATLYGTYFTLIADNLTNMFRLLSKVQSNFLCLMNNNIQFNCAFEDDLQTLIDVVESLGRIGELVIGLDIKTMAELWKGYSQLTQQYADHLRPQLDVATPIKFLCNYNSSCLKSVTKMDLTDTKPVTRDLKIGGFVLKLIIKLCESYSGYVGDCHEELLSLLLSLHQNSSSYLRLSKIPSGVSDDVHRHLTIGADTLLSTLIGEESFVQRYFHIDIKNLTEHGEILGFLLLSIAILRKLLHCEMPVRQMWQNNERDIFDFIFKSIDGTHPEMCWKLTMPAVVAGGETPRDAELYEALLTHLAAFAVSSTALQFPSVERTLLTSVLQPNIWRALLASDLWCIVARYGSSELCLEQLCFLINIYQRITADTSSPEKIYLETLLGRMFLMLSDKSKTVVVSMFPVTENLRLWETLKVNPLPDTLRSKLVENCIVTANKAISDFLRKEVSENKYSVMFNSLSGVIAIADLIPQNSSDDVSKLIGNILTLWHCVFLRTRFTTRETSRRGSQWLHLFVAKLCAATKSIIHFVTSHQLHQILQQLKNILQYSSSSLKISATTVLKCLANKFIEPSSVQTQVCQLIAALFASLLEDKNPVVGQIALETFAYFAHVTNHEEIVRSAVGRSKTIQHQVTAYLQKVPIQHFPGENGDKLAFDDYVQNQSRVKFLHKCVENDTESAYTDNKADAEQCSESIDLISLLNRLRKGVSLLHSLPPASLTQSVICDIQAIEIQLHEIVNR